MSLDRVALARLRVTRISARIHAGIVSARIQVETDRRSGLDRETRWRAWESQIKDTVRQLVREARIAFPEQAAA